VTLRARALDRAARAAWFVGVMLYALAIDLAGARGRAQRALRWATYRAGLALCGLAGRLDGYADR
jgi:threonine/homoserine/homoserine lactone efflux protein